MLKRKANKLSQIDNLSNNEKLINGFAWLSAGLLLSRLIGAVYIIFWSKWIGEHYELANSLYAIAYNPYVLFIDIATAGFPMAITKQVSQLNAQKEYKASMQLFKHSAIVMVAFGLIAASIFYLSAGFIANNSVQPTHNMMDNIRVLRTLTPTLVILPLISILRGFFQGNQQMTTPAVSQIIEQFVRVGYMLGMTYYVMKIKGGSFIEAVEQSTFAAFVGAAVTLIFLLIEFAKAYPYLMDRIRLGEKNIHINFKMSLMTVLKDSIPFVLMSMGASVLAIIDQFLYRPILHDFSDYDARKTAISYSWFSANTIKLTSIVGSLTMAMTTATIPNIATLYHKKSFKELAQSITKNLQFYLFIILPTAIGLNIVGNSMYRVFYSDANGAHVLKFVSLALITSGLFSIFVSMLQGMGKHHVALRAFSILIATKLLMDMIFIALFKEIGPGLADISAALLALFYLWTEMKHLTRFNARAVFHSLEKTILSTIFMSVFASLSYLILTRLLSEFGFLPNIIRVVVTAIVGAIAYAYASLKLGLLETHFPQYTPKIKRLFRMK
ncbi:polysaccharide biosynthesis protein [Carnobacteriaceae bacterium zg-C25]|nr:polysaccharide biosynthesis protein [Carnobacteriaceae bacterium zg-C25]